MEHTHNNQKGDGGGKRVMNIQAPSLSNFYRSKVMKFVTKQKGFSLKGY